MAPNDSLPPKVDYTDTEAMRLLGEEVGDALSALSDEVGSDNTRHVSQEEKRDILSQLAPIHKARHVLSKGLQDLIAGRDVANPNAGPTSEALEAFHEQIALELGVFQSLGLEGSDAAIDAMNGQALSHGIANLSHGAVLVEFEDREKYLQQIDTQLSYICEGLDRHLVTSQATRSTDQMSGDEQYAMQGDSPYSEQLTDIQSEGRLEQANRTIGI